MNYLNMTARPRAEGLPRGVKAQIDIDETGNKSGHSFYLSETTKSGLLISLGK